MRMVADHPEQTLRAPPLLFRRRPPQSNYPPDTVPLPDHGEGLGCQSAEGGIPRATPQRLAPLVRSLPPILYTANRQRYAFRAGRNLPDKEFRYLRTVIVTAAVYRGLDSLLRSR